MRKNICVCLALVILLSSVSMIAGAVDFDSIVVGTSELGIVEPKSLSTATLENDFADNHVLVVLNNKASLKFKEYSPADFKEVKCAAVSDLTSGKKKQVETKVNDFKSSVSTLSAESRAAAVEEINKYNQIICLELADKGKENVLAAIKALQSRDDVKYAGPDYVMTLCSTTPNDAYYGDQWAIPAIKLDKAWEITKGSSNVYVGILDSGIDSSHPDLQGKIATTLCADFTQTYVSYTVPSDYTGHGTHVAGIIAATMNNGQGIAGVASDVRIAAFRVFDASGHALSSKVALAIDYAEEMGLQILNFSGSWKPNSLYQYPNYDYALDEVIENYSGLFICSAGNQNYDIDNVTVYPASLDIDNLLVVGACTSNNKKCDSSSFGKESVDVFAPGEYILSCFPTAKCQSGTCESESNSNNIHKSNGYHYWEGTSMATPFVTGIALLMLSENPSLTTQQLKSKIIATCTYSSNLNNLCVSDGVVNAYAAVLSANTRTTLNINTGRTVSIAPGRSYWAQITVPYDGNYTFSTTGNLHTVGALYHPTSGLIERSSNANSSTSSNFYIEEYLTAGTTVYLRVTLKQASASGSFTLYIGS